MISIDKHAYNSKLKQQDPMQKFVFALATIGVGLWANSIPVSAAIILIMMWVTVRKGGTPLSLFLKLLLLPMSFLIIGILTIAVNVSARPGDFLISIGIFGTHLGVSAAGIANAGRLFFKALGAVSCLYYLSLSTPMTDLLSVLRKLKVPKLITELMSLIYRFVFVLLETADTMVTAQNSRLGYANFSSGFRSLSALVSTLFIRALKRSDEIYTALEARGYDGELDVLEEDYTYHWWGYAATACLSVVLVLATLYLRGFSIWILN